MQQFYVFANSEESLNIFNDNAGGRFRVYFPNPYVLDGNVGMCTSGGYVRYQVDHTDVKDLCVL